MRLSLSHSLIPFLIYYILTSFPSLLSISSAPGIHSSLSFQKTAGLPCKDLHGITSYSKPRHILSCQGWNKQPNGGLGTQSRPKCQSAPAPTQQQLCAEALGQTHAGSLTVQSLSLCEPCLFDSVGRVLLVSLTCLVPTIPPPHLPQDSWALIMSGCGPPHLPTPFFQDPLLQGHPGKGLVQFWATWALLQTVIHCLRKTLLSSV